MKIGITTYSLNDFDFLVQLNSMLEYKVAPDFIILHYAGAFNTTIRAFRFLITTIKQYRLKSFSYILSRTKGDKNENTSYEEKLSENNINNIQFFLSKANIIKCRSINDTSTINQIIAIGESMIVCNSGILKSKVLSLQKNTFLNIHASKLPEYRGMNNVEWALYENKEIYVSIHKITTGIDEGDILFQEKLKIENQELKSIEDYRKFVFFKSNQVIGKAIHKFLKGELFFIEQHEKNKPMLQYYTMHPILKEHLQKRLENNLRVPL